jgi:hypothetical protein
VSAGARHQDARPCRFVADATLTSRYLRFAYAPATGRWSVETVSGAPSLHLEARGCVELLDPEGQRVSRDVTTTTLIGIEPSVDESEQRIQARRCWADGLVAVQTFALARDAAFLTVTLAIEATRPVGSAVHVIEPLALPDRSNANLVVTPAFESVLDLGWSAAIPPRRSTIAETSEINATGLVALGSGSFERALVLALADGRDGIGDFRVQASSARSSPETTPGCRALKLDARAWVGDVDLAPGRQPSVALWIGVDRLDEALTCFAAQQRGLASRIASATQPAALSPGVGGDCHCSVWLGHGSPTSLDGPTFPIRPGPSALDEGVLLDGLANAVASGLTRAVDAALVPAGWQLTEGDSVADSAHLPTDIRRLVDAIHHARLRAGLDVAPFAARRSSVVVRDHPIWLLRAPNGDPVLVGDPAAESFALDATHPEVSEWIRSLGRQLVDWGFDCARIDSAVDGLNRGWRANGTISPLAAFRMGLVALRSGMAGRPIAMAGGPLFAALDLADVIETDSRLLTRADSAPLLRAFLGQCGPLASAGPLLLHAPEQTLDEARAAATVAAFAGGAMLLGDVATRLPTERARLVEACLPALHAAVLPVDPFAADGPRLFRATIQQRWEEWQLVIALNPANEPATIVASFESLGISGRHHAFEFWGQSYLGMVADRLVLDRIPAGGCQVISLHPIQVTPQVLATSLHVGLGAIDLQDVRWSDETADFSLSLTAVGDREGSVTIAVPPGWSPGSVRGSGGHFALRRLAGRLLQVDVRFRDVGEAQITFWPESR